MNKADRRRDGSESQKSRCVRSRCSPPSSACSARCSQRLVRSEMSARRRRHALQAIEQLRGPQHLDAWLRTLGDGLIGVSVSFPCGACSVWRHPSAWSTALKVMAFGQVPLVLCGVVSALAMTLGGSIGLSIGMMVLISGVLLEPVALGWVLIRIGSLPARQSVVMVLMILPLTSLCSRPLRA